MARHAAITGTGSYLPEGVLTNFDLEKLVDTSDEWIRQRTGIVERRIADPDMATSDLCVRAGRQAIKAAEIDPLDIEMVIVGTATPDTFFPSTACYVQQGIGAKNACGFRSFSCLCGLHLWTRSCRRYDPVRTLSNNSSHRWRSF